jgi:flagellar biogenesis protein FliO
MIFSYLLTLLGVCGLAVGSLVMLRSAKGRGLVLRNAQPIHVVGRQGLSAGSSLMLIEVDGQRLLIGVSRAGIALIDVKAAAQTNVVPIGQSFSAVIKRAGAHR